MAQKKCGAAVFRITTGTAKRRIEIQINKAVRTLPFSTMACRVIPTAEQNWRFCRKRESEDSFTNFLFSCKAEALLNKDKKSDLNMQRRGLVCPDYFRLPYLSYGTFLPFFSPMKPDDDTDTILPIASTGFCAYLSSFTL